MHYYIIPILETEPTHLILHGGTNDPMQSNHKKIVSDLLKLKLFILDELSSSTVLSRT